MCRGYNARDGASARMTTPIDFPRRRFLVAFSGALLVSRQSLAQSAAEVLVAAIQDGGKVIYVRHATTDQRQVDTGRLGRGVREAPATRLNWRLVTTSSG